MLGFRFKLLLTESASVFKTRVFLTACRHAPTARKAISTDIKTPTTLLLILEYSTYRQQTESSKFLTEGSLLKETLRGGRSVRYDRRIRKPKPTVSALPFVMKDMNWVSFKRFLMDRCSERVAEDRVRYAQKLGYCLFNRDFSELNRFAESKRRHALAGLSALAKFLGVYEEFKGLVKAYGLTWASLSADDLLIARMNKTVQNGDVLKWIDGVKARFPELHTFIDFMLASGLRFEEAINAFNLIVDLSKEDKLSSYYDREKQALEHYRFKSVFIRRTKKAFISFTPKPSLKESLNKRSLLGP
jgi:hypothetical protein